MSLAGFLAAKQRQSTYSLKDMEMKRSPPVAHAPLPSQREQDLCDQERAITPSPSKTYPIRIYGDVEYTPTHSLSSSRAFTSPDVSVVRAYRPDVSSTPIFTRPQKQHVLKEGAVWIKKLKTWQSVHGIVSKDSQSNSFQIYSTEQSAQPYRTIDLTKVTSILADHLASKDNFIFHTFKINFNNYEILAACESEVERNAWVDAMQQVETGSDYVQERNMVKEIVSSARKGESKGFKMTTLKDVSDLIDKRCAVLEEKIAQMHTSTSSTLTTLTTLGISTKTFLNANSDNTTDHDSVQDNTDRLQQIQETVEFISKSSCKLVDLFTDKFKGLRSPLKLAQDESRLLAKIESVEGTVSLTQSTLKTSIDEIVAKISSSCSSADSAKLAKIQEAVESISAKLTSERNDRTQQYTARPSAPNSPEKQNSNLLLSMNDKLVKLTTHLESLHETSRERFSGIDEKIRLILTRTNDKSDLRSLSSAGGSRESDGKEVRVLGEVKNGLLELEVKFGKMCRDQKSASENTIAAIAKLSMNQANESSVDERDVEVMARLGKIETILNAVQERLAARVMRKSPSITEIASKAAEEKIDAWLMRTGQGISRSSSQSQLPLSMNDGILKIMRGEKQDMSLSEQFRSDRLEREAFTTLMHRTLTDNAEMRQTLSSIQHSLSVLTQKQH